MKIPIVVVTFNREKSLNRLLKSLSRAYYDNDSVELIISIDKSDNPDVYKIAKGYKWDYGKKTVLMHKNNLGLRKHILQCGDITLENEAVIILEDDLVVSKSFYRYAKQSYKYYKDNKRIAGISLYTYRVNEFSNLRPFIPIQDDSDVFFAMVPSSWGQMWTKEQWFNFKNWYEHTNFEIAKYRGSVPDVVLDWRESSWKKYFHIYLSEQKKFIVYPRVAQSTNMGDKGTHNIFNSNSHQSILMGEFSRDFVFKGIDDPFSIKYDAFFESITILSELLQYENNIIIDYYGTKKKHFESGLLLSVEKLNYKIVHQWGLELVPYELNIQFGISGYGVFLYDLSKPYKNLNDFKLVNLIKYEIPSITKGKALMVCLNYYKNAIIRRLR